MQPLSFEVLDILTSCRAQWTGGRTIEKKAGLDGALSRAGRFGAAGEDKERFRVGDFSVAEQAHNDAPLIQESGSVPQRRETDVIHLTGIHYAAASIFVQSHWSYVTRNSLIRS